MPSNTSDRSRGASALFKLTNGSGAPVPACVKYAGDGVSIAHGLAPPLKASGVCAEGDRRGLRIRPVPALSLPSG
eukprot:3257718-Karenia_brevis.AAC.1